MKAIEDLSRFRKLVRLCAGRIGQILNKSSLAVECGVTSPTVDSWLSVLEESYIVYFLRPDYRNFSKRLVKSPKLYFYDTGLACATFSTDYFKGLDYWAGLSGVSPSRRSVIYAGETTLMTSSGEVLSWRNM